MATRRRSRRKTISGNLTDIQKRIRYLETRPSASRLASKAVATRNIALRAVDEEVVADNAIVRRAIAAGAVGTAQIEDDSITSNLLASNSVGTDAIAPDSITTNELATDAVTTDNIATGAVTAGELGTDAVTTEKIATGAVTNNELSGGITDDKISGMSASKLIGDVQDDQIAGMSSSKLIGDVQDDQIAGISGSKIIGGLDGSLIVNGSIQAIKIAGVNSSVLIGDVQASQIGDLPASQITTGTFSADRIPNLDAAKITTGTFATGRIPSITNAMLAGGITNGKIASVDAATITTGTIPSMNRLPAEILTGLTGSGGIIITGSGRTRNVAFSGGSYALANHTHSTYAANQRYDTSMAGSHVGHGGHTHFITTVSSTRKLKKEISDYSIDLEKLLLLQPKRFKYRNQARMASKNREWDYGYIAEEALELGVEEIVGYDEKGEVDSINYGLLSVFVLELVKKQQDEINLLSEEIKRLKETR
jgi:hypothetical protein